MPAHLLAALLCLPGQTTVDELIAAHEATMAKIKSVAVECDIYRQQPGKSEVLERRDAWAKDANSERRRFGFLETTFSDGTPLGDVCGDLLIDKTSVRLLMNWDDVRGKAAIDSKGIRAEILPPGAYGHAWFHDSSFLLLQRVQPETTNWTVGEYLRKFPSATKVLPPVVHRGRTLIPVSVDPGGVKVKSTIYFAPECDGLVLKQVHDYPVAASRTVPMRSEATVVEIGQFAGEIRLPTRIKYQTTIVGPPVQVIDEVTVVSQVAVNDDVPADALDFRFPAGTIVVQRSPTGGLGVEHVWGPDNEPAETRVPTPPWWMYALAVIHFGIDTRLLTIIALLLALLSATAYYLIRRQRRKLQAAVTG